MPLVLENNTHILVLGRILERESDTCAYRQSKVSETSYNFQVLILKHYEEVPSFQAS